MNRVELMKNLGEALARVHACVDPEKQLINWMKEETEYAPGDLIQYLNAQADTGETGWFILFRVAQRTQVLTEINLIFQLFRLSPILDGFYVFLRAASAQNLEGLPEGVGPTSLAAWICELLLESNHEVLKFEQFAKTLCLAGINFVLGRFLRDGQQDLIFKLCARNIFLFDQVFDQQGVGFFSNYFKALSYEEFRSLAFGKRSYHPGLMTAYCNARLEFLGSIHAVGCLEWIQLTNLLQKFWDATRDIERQAERVEKAMHEAQVALRGMSVTPVQSAITTAFGRRFALLAAASPSSPPLFPGSASLSYS